MGKHPRGEGGDISPPSLRRKVLHNSAFESLPTVDDLGNQHQEKLEPPLFIFSWNVNGVAAFLQKPITSFLASKPQISNPHYSLRSILQKINYPQFFCLQEVKINPNDEATQRALEHAANGDEESDGGPGYTAHYCLPRDKFNAKGFGGKVYGVATFIRNDFLAEVEGCREVRWDFEGRVLVTEMKNGLVVINGYWVNGTENPYRDSDSGEVIGTRHDRKRAFHELMLGEVLEYERQGKCVILVGDMNIARNHLDGYPGIRLGHQHVRSREDFNEKFFHSGMQGIDTFRYFKGDERKYTYRGRNHQWGASCDRVDLIIASKSLLSVPGLMLDSDILDTPADRGHSDHVPLYLMLDMNKLQRRWQ